MRTAPPPQLLLVALTLVALGCDGSASSGGRPGDAHAPAPPPSGLLLELGAADLPHFFGTVRGQIQRPVVRELVPTSGADLLTRIAPVPDEVAARMPEDAALRGLMIAGAAETPGWIHAVPLRVERSEAHPLGVTVRTTPGAPQGGLWVGGPPSLDHPPTVLLDGLLFVATDQATLEAGLAYLRDRMRAPERPPAGLTFRVPSGVIAERGRAEADAALEAITARALTAAAAERARHEEAPTLGEPERLVAQLRAPLARWVAFLPDVGEATLRLTAGATGLEARLDAEVTAGSPLAAALEALPTGAPFGLAALPVGTAIAVSRRGPGDRAWLDALVDISGERLSTDDRAALAAGYQTLESASAEGSLRAVGTSDAGPWALLGGRGAALDLDALTALLAVEQVRAVLGRALGCDGAAAAARFGDAAEGAHSARLCEISSTQSAAEVTVAEVPSAFALTLSRRPNRASGPQRAAVETARALAGQPGSTLGSRPDTARALTALGEVSLAAILVPSRVAPSLALVGAGAAAGSDAAAEETPPAPTPEPAPTFLAFGHTAGRASLQVLVVPHGLDRLAELAVVARAVAGAD